MPASDRTNGGNDREPERLARGRAEQTRLDDPAKEGGKDHSGGNHIFLRVEDKGGNSPNDGTLLRSLPCPDSCPCLPSLPADQRSERLLQHSARAH